MALAFFVSDLRELLDELPLVRRQVVLFALQADMELRDAVDLRWRDVGSLQLDALSEAILVARERHPKVDYVFWEELSNGVIAPLFGIHESVWASTAETDLGPASVKIGTHPVLGDLTMVDCISEKKAIVACCEREAYTLIGFIVSKGGTWPVAL